MATYGVSWNINIDIFYYVLLNLILTENILNENIIKILLCMSLVETHALVYISFDIWYV